MTVTPLKAWMGLLALLALAALENPAWGQEPRDCGTGSFSVGPQWGNPLVNGRVARDGACRIRWGGTRLRTITAPQNGTIEIDAAGIIYRPRRGFVGRDSFRMGGTLSDAYFDVGIDVR